MFRADVSLSLSFRQQFSVYPIIWAAGRGHADIVKLLLQNGAKVNCSDKVTTRHIEKTTVPVTPECSG